MKERVYTFISRLLRYGGQDGVPWSMPQAKKDYHDVEDG